VSTCTNLLQQAALCIMASGVVGATGPVIAFVGSGNIASAVIRGLIQQGVTAAGNIRASSPSGGSAALSELGIVCLTDNAAAVAEADVVVIAVKPYNVAAAVESFRDVVRPAAVIVSVAAGITIKQIQRVRGHGRTR
jgi:pyrroline-5-carboxylate reductase